MRFLPFFLLACGTPPSTPADPDDSAEPDDTAIPPDACATLGLASRAFTDATAAGELYATAADFTLETTDGDWNLREHWTGCDSYLFIQDEPAQNGGFPTPLWERDVDALFELLPPNVELFFVSTKGGETARAEALDGLRSEVDRAFNRMSAEDVAWWTPRVHYVTTRDTAMDSYLGDLMGRPGWGVGIDRFQRIRYIGSYADPERYYESVGWFEPNLSMAANESIYYNFEAARDEAMALEGATVVEIFTSDVVSGSVEADIELPDMSGYDTLTVDATMGCGGVGEYGYCPAWDYMAYLYLRVEALPADNPWAETACQPRVEAVSGVCHGDGVATETACTDVGACEDSSGAVWTCEGYAPTIYPDTQPGQCFAPGGQIPDGTFTCNATGTGYDALSCPTEIEVGRWITTYHREGRWVYDISAMLPFLVEGGPRHFRFETSGPYTLSVSLRYSSQAKAAVPAVTDYAFSGGYINVNYNAGYAPYVFDVPADAVKVELATVISQHGSDGNNCGEFCDIAHHFTVNGNANDEIVRSFPEASTAYDCMEKAAEGTVPNQYGTWWYGRAGWCPGKEVPTVMADITDQVTVGGENTLEYRGLYRGADYTGGATILMRSWIVISK